MVEIAKIREALKDRNIQVVSENTKISASTLYRIANGKKASKPNQSTLRLLAGYLGIGVKDGGV